MGFFHPKKLLLVFLLILVALVFFYFYGRSEQNFTNTSKSLFPYQDGFSDIAAAKLMGDSLVAGLPVADMSMDKVADITQASLDNMSKITLPGFLTSYQDTIINWSNSIKKSAQDSKTWKGLGDQPADFTLSLSDSDTKEYLQSSTDKIAVLKEAGDAAIRRGDRKTMYYIGAKLLVQAHWLNGVLLSTPKSFLSQGQLTNIARAAGSTTTYGPINKRPGYRTICTTKVQAACNFGFTNGVMAVYRAAVNYAAAKPAAEEDWNKAWNEENLKVLTGAEAGGQVVKTGGIKLGDPVIPWDVSPREKVFYDECGAKGGSITNISGGGVNKLRLPTSESGYTCAYKSNNTSCWDYLTYSGGRYMGGDNGCPEQGLMPKPQQVNTLPAPRISWDGLYHCTLTRTTCSNIEPAFTIEVKNNQIIDADGNKNVHDINTSGRARMTGGVAGEYWYDYDVIFSKSGDTYTVKGSGSTVGYDGSGAHPCNQDFTGTRK